MSVCISENDKIAKYFTLSQNKRKSETNYQGVLWDISKIYDGAFL